jgi:DNA-binding MarR family transcriptional regulator
MEPLEFLSLLWSVDHELHVASKRQRGRLGVTGPQRVAIRLIAREPGIGPGKLAGLLQIHPSTLTGILRRLEEHGYIRRYSDARDARRTLLGLTDKGRTIDGERSSTIEAIVGDALQGVPSTELSAARHVLATLTAALSGAATPPIRG